MKIKQGFLCLAQVDKLARAERTLLHKGEWVHGTSHPEGGGGVREAPLRSYLHDIMGKVCPYPFINTSENDARFPGLEFKVQSLVGAEFKGQNSETHTYITFNTVYEVCN